jgi:hypothetical protein
LIWIEELPSVAYPDASRNKNIGVEGIEVYRVTVVYEGLQAKQFIGSKGVPGPE